MYKCVFVLFKSIYWNIFYFLFFKKTNKKNKAKYVLKFFFFKKNDFVHSCLFLTQVG